MTFIYIVIYVGIPKCVVTNVCTIPYHSGQWNPIVGKSWVKEMGAFTSISRILEKYPFTDSIHVKKCFMLKKHFVNK